MKQFQRTYSMRGTSTEMLAHMQLEKFEMMSWPVKFFCVFWKKIVLQWMTAKDEVSTGDFFRLYKIELNSRFCDICNRQFDRSAYYRHIKSDIHSTALHKIFFSDKRTSHQEQQRRKLVISALKAYKEKFEVPKNSKVNLLNAGANVNSKTC